MGDKGNGGPRLPPFDYALRVKSKVSHKSELRHIGLCLLVCVPTCATVCLIVDRLLGG